MIFQNDQTLREMEEEVEEKRQLANERFLEQLKEKEAEVEASASSAPFLRWRRRLSTRTASWGTCSTSPTSFPTVTRGA